MIEGGVRLGTVGRAKTFGLLSQPILRRGYERRVESAKQRMGQSSGTLGTERSSVKFW